MDAETQHFLLHLRLDKYTEMLATSECDWQCIVMCDEKDLKEFGLPKGPRVKILKALPNYVPSGGSAAVSPVQPVQQPVQPPSPPRQQGSRLGQYQPQQQLASRHRGTRRCAPAPALLCSVACFPLRRACLLPAAPAPTPADPSSARSVFCFSRLCSVRLRGT